MQVPRAPEADAIDWRRVLRHVAISRALDDLEESTLLKERKVLYQFSARGHDLTQVLLSTQLTGAQDGVGGYYRSRPLLAGSRAAGRRGFGVDHDARRRHERRTRYRRRIQHAAQSRALRAAGVRRRRRAIHPGSRMGAGAALSL